MSNKSNGTMVENRVAQLLFDFGYWVTLLQQSEYGQPADMMACKSAKTLLIDAKDCEKNNFRLTRIEPNQRNAMTWFEQKTRNKAWFALRLTDGTIYFWQFDALLDMEEHGVKSLSEVLIRQGSSIYEI